MASTLANFIKLMYLCITVSFTKAQLSGDLRLMDGTSEINGRLEVYRSGQWGTVCNNGFDKNDGTVACRQLGFEYNSHTHSSRNHDFGGRSSTTWLANARCSGSETRLDACDGEWSRYNSCYNDVVLTCRESNPPVVSGCPNDIEVSHELGTSGTTVTWTEPTATDATTVTTFRSHEPGTFFFGGVTHVAYIYTDTSDNIAACSFSIIVHTADTTPPTITNCTHEIRVTAELGTNETDVLWNEPNATDISGTPHKISSHAPLSTFPLGVTEVTYSFVDASNNKANCTFTVIVEKVDTTPPEVFQCPSDFSSVGGRHVSWREPIASDLSNNITLLKSHSPGLFVTEDTQVVYNFTDASGNSGYCRFMISIILDTTAPQILNCPSDITVTIELGETESVVKWTEPETIVASENSTRTSTHTPGQQFPVGITMVVYVFQDSALNQASCSFSVHVETEDTKAPTILHCPSDIFTAVEAGSAESLVSWIEPETEDESESVTLMVQTHASGAAFMIGSTTVFYLFKDDSNNVAVCSFVVTLKSVDTKPPDVFGCPADIHTTADIGAQQATILWTEPWAYDKSGSVVLLHQTHQSGEDFEFGLTPVSYTFTDHSNNVAICAFVIVVNEPDISPPSIDNCPDDIISHTELEAFGTIVSWIEPEAIDNSGNAVLLLQTHDPGTFFAPGTTKVTYIFKDGSNNMEKCSFSVTVAVKTSSRIYNCPVSIVASLTQGKNATNIMWTEPFVIDFSAKTKSMSSTHRPNDLFRVGKTDVMYKFEDESSSFQFCNFTVTVINSVEQLDDDNLDIDTPPYSEFLQKKDDHYGVAIAGLVIAIFIVMVGCSIFLLICFLRRKNTCTDIEESLLSMIASDQMDKNTDL